MQITKMKTIDSKSHIDINIEGESYELIIQGSKDKHIIYWGNGTPIKLAEYNHKTNSMKIEFAVFNEKDLFTVLTRCLVWQVYHV